MAALPISHADAQHRLLLVEAALRRGHRPPGLLSNHNNRQVSAIRAAYEEYLTENPNLSRSKGVNRGWILAAVRVLGTEPNWQIYEDANAPSALDTPYTGTPLISTVSDRTNQPHFEVPLSEDQAKFHADWGPTECIEELRRLALANPDRIISRNFFRVESQISESTWNRYFGTFEEFKRQAGIKLTRAQHRLERNIAKHASVDTYRALNLDKTGWEGEYLKPHRTRFQTVLVCSDVHDRDCDPFWRHCFIDTARRVQPDTIIFNGDIFDLPEFGKYTVDPRTWDVLGRIKWVHAFLADLRAACPDATFYFIEGNHEFRLMRHLAEATPAMMTVLADLHGFTVPKLLGLDTYEVNYIARMDLAVFSERDIKAEMSKNYLILHDAVLAHHFPEGRDFGYPGWNGHHHKHIVWTAHSPQFGTYEWHQLGCGHRRWATYTAGEKWGLGFLLAHVDTHTHATQFEYVEIRDHAVIGGKWYTRESLAHDIAQDPLSD